MRLIDRSQEPHGLPVLRAAQLAVQPAEEKWLVQSLWTRESVGIVGGAAKTFKTWMGLDMAISVASGVPCLDRFDVDDPGPSLVYLAEDALPAVRERIDAISLHKKVDVRALDLHVITSPILRLDVEDDRRDLSATVDRLRPKLLLLDPLVRLHGLDENDSGHMSSLLGFLRELQRTLHVAVVLVHHASKRYRSTPGHGLRGSGDIHAFADSSLYLVRHDDQIRLTVEHRSATSPPPLALHLASRGDGTGTHLELVSENRRVLLDAEPDPLQHQVLEYLLKERRPCPGNAIRAALKVNNKRLWEALKDLERLGRIEKTQSGWRARTPDQPTLPFH